MTKAEREACKAEFITGNYRTLTEYADAHELGNHGQRLELCSLEERR